MHRYAQIPSLTAAGFSLLLQHGADINARCSEGRTCLHYLFIHAGTCRSPYGHIQYLDACQYLVRSGADVDAVDTYGISVSKLAYSCYNGSLGIFLNSVGGDIWDRVLAGAGFDVASFRTRHGFRRRARYTANYKRSDFEAMWAGMTELCPYYHDPEPSYDRFYSAKSLLGFRSLWCQWGEDLVVGSLKESRRDGYWVHRSIYNESCDTDMEEWSAEEEGSPDDTSAAESDWDSDGLEDIDQGSNRESNIYEASDKGSHHARGQDSVRDSDRENDGDDDRDIDDDSDDGDSDDGGCRL